MDFTFTEEQQAAAEAARGVFAGVAPDAVPSPALTAGRRRRRLRPRAVGQARRGGPAEPAAGRRSTAGRAWTPIALCLVLRESAKVLARVPLLESSAAAAAVQAYGGEELRSALLARAGRGRGRADRRRERPYRPRPGRTRRDRAAGRRRVGPGRGADGGAVGAHRRLRRRTGAHAPPAGPSSPLVPRIHQGVVPRRADLHHRRAARRTAPGIRADSDRDVIDADGAWEWLRDLLTAGTCALASAWASGCSR